MTVEERRRRRFSESFRKEQVKLIDSGAATVQEISLRYEVKQNSVRLWLKRFGSKTPAEPILITNSSEINRLKQLEKENQKLYELLGKQHTELIYKTALLKLAQEKLGEDLEKK